jgi:hypothetical protein
MSNFSNSPGASTRLEQKADSNGGKPPNFGLIVAVASVLLVLGLIAAYVLVGADGRHLLPKLRPNPHPTSRLSLPGDGLNLA